MKKKAACFVAALAIFAQNSMAITPKLEHILEGSQFYMACIMKRPDAQADNAEAVAAPLATTQPDNDEQVKEFEEKLKKKIVHISPALFVNCDALTGHLKRKGQHALSKKFEDYAERLYNRPRANIRFDKILQFELPETTIPASEVDPHFIACAKAFHEQLNREEITWNTADHQDSFDPDRPTFFFTRHLFKGFFDHETEAFKTAYDHAKAKEAFYRDLQEAQSALSEDPVADMLQKVEQACEEALKVSKKTIHQNVVKAAHLHVSQHSALSNILDDIKLSCHYTSPSIHDHLEAKRVKWQSRRESLSQLCVENNIPL